MSNVVFFDGTDDYVDCVPNAGLNITDNLTMEIWFKHKLKTSYGTPGIYAGLLQKGGRPWMAGGAYGLSYHTGNLNVYAYYRDNTNALYNSVYTGLIDPDKWYHVVSTFATGTMKIYVNGNLIQTAAAGFNTLNTNVLDLYIGGLISSYYAGFISETRIYNVVLSDTDILYNNSHPNNPKRRGLVLNLTQDSIYGPQWNDLSGNANNGTYVGGAVPVTANRLAGR